MKENKGKEVVNEAVGQEVLPQPHPLMGDKRKNLSLGFDWGTSQAGAGRKRLNTSRLSLRTSSPHHLFISMSLRTSRSLIQNLRSLLCKPHS